MDESMMNVWIEQVLSLWKDTLPPKVVPLLILDSFCVHMMGGIVTKIQLLGIEVQCIPGGCTYLCQPINISVNKPIKIKVMEQWEDWVDMEGVQKCNKMKTPSHEDIANGLEKRTGCPIWKCARMHGEKGLRMETII